MADVGLCGGSCGGATGPFCCGVYLPWPVGGRGREVKGSSSKKLVEVGLAAGACVAAAGGVLDGSPGAICDEDDLK